MAKVGRKGKYESLIKPKFNEIKESLNGAASEEQVAKSLGISYSAWNKYKREHQEFYELVNAPRTQLIDNLKSALVKRALGYDYTEKKKVLRRGAGEDKAIIEEYTKHCPPEVNAICIALRMYDKSNAKDYDIQSQSIDIKKAELELKKWTLSKEGEW